MTHIDGDKVLKDFIEYRKELDAELRLLVKEQAELVARIAEKLIEIDSVTSHIDLIEQGAWDK